MKDVLLDIRTLNGKNKMEEEMNAYLKKINHFLIQSVDRDFVMKKIKEKIESIHASSKVKRNIQIMSCPIGMYVYYEGDDRPIANILVTEIDGCVYAQEGVMLIEEYDEEGGVL